MTTPILTIARVSKRFGRFQALTDVSLTVATGDIYGLIGENGAGKTTLMRLITGLSPMQDGRITLLGETAGHYRQALARVGAVIESPAAFEQLTVAQNVHLCAIQHGLNDPAQEQAALDFVGLSDKARAKARHLSLGQKQRLGLALAILPRPDLLVLDEPINGLDPSGIIEFRELLQQLNRERQTTILISSHILAELGQVATRFGFLHRGRLIQELTKAELDAANQEGLRITVDDAAKAAQLLDSAGVAPFEVLDDARILIRQADADAASLNRLLVEGGVAVADFAHESGSLEDYYTRLLRQQEGGQAND